MCFMFHTLLMYLLYNFRIDGARRSAWASQLCVCDRALYHDVYSTSFSVVSLRAAVEKVDAGLIVIACSDEIRLPGAFRQYNKACVVKTQTEGITEVFDSLWLQIHNLPVPLSGRYANHSNLVTMDTERYQRLPPRNTPQHHPHIWAMSFHPRKDCLEGITAHGAQS